MATDGDFHSLWRWIRKVKPDGKGGNRTYPMRNASGELTNDLAELLEIWAQHAKKPLRGQRGEDRDGGTTTETTVTAAGADTGTTMQRLGVEALNAGAWWKKSNHPGTAFTWRAGL